MLHITIPGREMWNDKDQEFIYEKSIDLVLEHSLVSISKWESKWRKPFISETKKTVAETLDYVRCMTITQNVHPETYNKITEQNITEINAYIEHPMTATWFKENNSSKKSSEQITSELIYYWMISLQIPWECQRWHLNRLLTLIRICNVKNQPPKKQSRQEVIQRNRDLNAKRRQNLGTSG